jgi:hypothetical protein
MGSPVAIAIAALLLWPAIAHAGDSRRSLGGGLSLVVEGDHLYVARGVERARLAQAHELVSAVVRRAQRKVDVLVLDSTCDGESRYTWGLAELAARVENAAAYRLHRRRDYARAAAGFARAVAAAPAWKVAATNLASAEVLRGDAAAAIRALAPWLAAEPIATYVKVATDPELAPLLVRPELRAIRARRRGAVQLSDERAWGRVAYEPVRGLLAVARTEGSWGACVYRTDLEIHDARSGRRIAVAPMVAWEETSFDCDVKAMGVLPARRAAVAARVKRLAAMLADLGFSSAAIERAEVGSSDGDRQTGSFPRHALGLAARGGVARVLRGDQVLASRRILDHIDAAVWVEDARAAVVWSIRPGREGCEGTDPTAVTVLPAARPAGPGRKPR